MSRACGDGVLRPLVVRRAPQGSGRLTVALFVAALSGDPGSRMKSTVVRTVVLLGAVYAVAGIVFGALAGRAASREMLVAWRWAAWGVSAVAFGAHIVYEQVRLRTSP